MSAYVDQVTLREAVFKACNTLDAFESMPYSTIRKETERLLGMEKKALKDRKDDITEMIFQFRNVHKLKKQKKSHDSSIQVLKKGKYSKYETELILSAIYDYVEANDLELTDVCSEMREKTEKYKRHTVLWDSLTDLLPHRDRVSIREHANRKLMSGSRTGTFTEEEKKRVLQMASLYGHDWKRIANELGRMTGDIKDLHKILETPRINSGHFTLQEAARLIMAVKQVTRCPNELKSFEIPYENISWKSVAHILKNERQPLDYLRHWKVIRRNTWLGPELVAGMVTTSQQRADDRKIIAHIAELEPEDVSEVTWSQVDAALLTRSLAFLRWCSLCKENLLNYQLDFCGSLAFLMKKLNVLEGGVLGPEEEAAQDSTLLLDQATAVEVMGSGDNVKEEEEEEEEDEEEEEEDEEEDEEEEEEEEEDVVDGGSISLAAALAAALPPPSASASATTPYTFVKSEVLQMEEHRPVDIYDTATKKEDKKMKKKLKKMKKKRSRIEMGATDGGDGSDVVVSAKKNKQKKEGRRLKIRDSSTGYSVGGEKSLHKKKKKKKEHEQRQHV